MTSPTQNCREFVPKGVSIHHLTEEHILSFKSALNSRPRNTLAYRTAQKKFLMQKRKRLAIKPFTYPSLFYR